MSTNDPSSAPPSEPKLEAEVDAMAEPKKTMFTPVQEAWERFPYKRSQGLFWLVVLATSTLTGAIAFQWLTGLPPIPSCRKLFNATLSDSGQLYCADQSARKGDEASLSAALQLAGSITASDPLFEQSRQLSDHWSESILVLARKKVETGDLKKGIALAQKVPKTSGVYANAQAMIQDWQGNWKKGDVTFKKAKGAIQDQNWGLAMEQVRDLMQLGSSYWQGQADKIVKEMSVEQEAFYKISAAQSIADGGRPEDFAKAIQSVSKIDPKRLARKRVGEKIDEWSEKLVAIAKSAQSNGDYTQMVNAAQKVPPTAKAANVAASYLQLGRAGTAAKDETLWSVIQAHAFSAQIDAKTPVFLGFSLRESPQPSGQQGSASATPNAHRPTRRWMDTVVSRPWSEVQTWVVVSSKCCSGRSIVRTLSVSCLRSSSTLKKRSPACCSIRGNTRVNLAESAWGSSNLLISVCSCEAQSS